MSHTFLQGDCLKVMADMDDNSIDFIVTDPPYGLSFMGKEWDHGVPGVEFWKEALRICKPGSMMAAFGGTRTYHRLTCAIEDAGWEIRDCMMYLYGSGFPKSHNKFGLDGYGTALKPAWEPILIAMKPLDGTFAQNAEKWRVAGINIDDCRISTNELKSYIPRLHKSTLNDDSWLGQDLIKEAPNGRWPANLILNEEAAQALDQQTGNNVSRFFYCAKASSAERNAGLEGMPLVRSGVERMNNSDGRKIEVGEAERLILTKNPHPTVKPLALMRYVIKLLAPPGNPTLLDPFAGSGTTIIAAKQLGISAIGIELSSEYCEIAMKRIEHHQALPEQLEMDI